MRRVVLIPTGDEIRDGTVLDLDSPEIMRIIVREWPCAEVVRLAPVVDVESEILSLLEGQSSASPDLIVLIGGSGGGHRFSESLGRDFTHTALEKFLDTSSAREIYGKNGHLWSKIICGKKGAAIVANVPGPFVEASAAASALVEAISGGASIDEIDLAMARAVYAQYPTGAIQPEDPS